MGGGTWTANAYKTYATTKFGADALTSAGTLKATINRQDVYKATSLDPALDPRDAFRECRDTEEHPNTVPVILALDVTGSMGSAALAVARELNSVMLELYEKIPDVEFCIMALGDTHYDKYPIQMSQFESDIRVAENLDKVVFEGGGGCNSWESYTAAWYMAANRTDLDCWKRGKKGILITMGDEPINPYLDKKELSVVLGDIQATDSELLTKDLYKQVSERYDVHHICVDHRCISGCGYEHWESALPQGHVHRSSVDEIKKSIIGIITECYEKEHKNTESVEQTHTEQQESPFNLNNEGEIVW